MKDIEKLGTICGKIISLGLSNDTEALEKATEELLQFLQQPKMLRICPSTAYLHQKKDPLQAF